MTNPTRAGLYSRVSKTGGRDDAMLERHTLSQQRDLARDFLPRSIEMVDDVRYRDVNVSGTHSQRPGLETIFADVEAGRLDSVVVGYLSRFGRNTRELLDNVERLHKANATLYIARDGLIVSPGQRGTAKLLLVLLAAIAEVEADRYADNLSDANARAIAGGVSISVPYGYVREDGAGSLLAFDERDDLGPAPADVVRRIFEMRCNDWSWWRIAGVLNDENILPPSAYAAERGRRTRQIAQRWSHSAVTTLVSSPTYTGVIPRWQTDPNGKRIASTLELLPGGHPALVERDSWYRAQCSPRKARNGRVASSLLLGLVRCASCSRSMSPSKNAGRETYACRGRKSGCERPATIVREHLDRFVEQQLLDALGDGGFGTREPVDRTEIERLDVEIERAHAELEAFRETSSPVDLGADFVPILRRLRSDVDRLERERADLLSALGGDDDMPTPDVYEKLDVEQRNRVLSVMLDAVVVLPARQGQRSDRDVAARVGAIVAKGQSPIALSRSGSPQPPRAFPIVTEAHAPA